MKTLLVAINSQYVHTNLAVEYLSAACSKECGLVRVMQFTINENRRHIYGCIIREKPDVVAFSCYIWNVEQIAMLAADIKKAVPGIIIIAGGPEVSFDNESLLSKSGMVDYLICGEGEEKLPSLLRRLNQGMMPDEKEIQWFKRRTMISDLESLQIPYGNLSADSLEDRIAYVEASRGCPFHCSYCISSLTGSVRYFPLEWVYRVLDTLVASGTKIIKFVDRTFNANEERAIQIINYIQRYAQTGIVFHFEIAPGLLSEKIMNCFEKVPQGLIQIEAGIQSVHEKTLSAVERPQRIGQAFSNLKRLLEQQNMHVHVDLIAGLPFETFSDFQKSFNQVYVLFAHYFQLGFLKMLRGSKIRNNASLHQYVFSDYPPYEIIANQYMCAEELLELKDMEKCLDIFYNSGRFAITMKYVNSFLKKHSGCEEPFLFYRELSLDMRERGYMDRSLKAKDTYFMMYRFLVEKESIPAEIVKETLRFDYLRAMRNPSLPAFMEKEENMTKRKERFRWMNENRALLEKVLPRLNEITLDKIIHQVYVSCFNLPKLSGFSHEALIAVDFGDVSPVTGLANAYYIGKTDGSIK